MPVECRENLSSNIAVSIERSGVTLVLELTTSSSLVKSHVALLQHVEEQVILLEVQQTQTIHADLKTAYDALYPLWKRSVSIAKIRLKMPGEGIQVKESHGETHDDETTTRC